MESIKILGVNVNKTDMKSAVEKATGFLETDGLSMIFTPNSEIILYASENKEYTDIINSADMVLPDGIGVIYGAKILRTPLIERVAGYDFVISFMDVLSKKGKSIYLLGAKRGVALAAAENLLKKYPGIVIAGTHDGYFKDDSEVIEDINNAKPDFLMVCLGFPKQERWIYENKDKLNAKIAIGAGGCLDVIAGNVQRAPQFFCEHGIEWLYRLIKQPSRFVRMLALPKFALKVIFKGKRYN